MTFERFLDLYAGDYDRGITSISTGRDEYCHIKDFLHAVGEVPPGKMLSPWRVAGLWKEWEAHQAAHTRDVLYTETVAIRNL